jgi:hypothetical protein
MAKEKVGIVRRDKVKDKNRPVVRQGPAAGKSVNRTKRKQRPPRSVRTERTRPDVIPVPNRHGVSITVQLPALRRPRLNSRPNLRAVIEQPSERRKLLKKAFIPAVIAAVLVVLLIIHLPAEPAKTTKVTAGTERTKPTFQPLVPAAAEASATSYDGKRNMVSYTTTFSGARLTVSQQPLPPRFSTDPKALQAAVDSINAKQRIDTLRGPLFIATNQTNDQLAVFAGKEVLLFIHSDRKMDDASWKAFIELLKTK